MFISINIWGSEQEDATLPHLRFARQIITDLSSGPCSTFYGDRVISNTSKILTFYCYQFINHLLNHSLSLNQREELSTLYNLCHQKLPKEHQSNEWIPYYYHLGGLHLSKTPFHYFKSVKISDIKPGDILTYIDLNYEPDLLKRDQSKPSGTHVMLLDSISRDVNTTWIKVIDCSQRSYLREYDDNKQANNELGGIAYSLANISSTDQDHVWSIRWKGYSKPMLKYLSAIRIIDDKNADANLNGNKLLNLSGL